LKITKISELRASLREQKNSSEKSKIYSPLGFAIYDSINYVNKNSWERVIPEQNLMMRFAYLNAVEKSSELTHKHRYVLIYHNNEPVAAAIFNIIDIGAEDFGSIKEKSTTKIVNKLKNKATLRVLICGNVHLSGEHGFYYNKKITSEDAYQALAEAAYRIRQSEKHRGRVHIQLIKDFYQPEFENSEHLKVAKYRKFEVDPNMIVHIRENWMTFEDYLSAMKSKYRNRAKSAEKKGKSLERRILSTSEIEYYQERINELYENVAAKARFRIVKIPPQYFYFLSENLQEDFEFLGYFLDGKMVGFTCSIFWGDNCEGHTIGLDYRYNTKYSIYQNILYDDIKMAIKRGKKTVIFGRTAIEIKSAVGAEPAEMQCFIRHPNRVTNKLLKPIFRHIKTSSWTQRLPFK